MHGASQDRAIWDRLDQVRERIEAACARCGRMPDQVRLVVVSKGRGLAAIRAVHEAGLRDFGENRIEEAGPKIDGLRGLEGVRWHMIGHVQSRKAQSVVGQFFLIHSVDRMKLATRLDRFAGLGQPRLAALLECNVSGESTKEGWEQSEPTAWAETTRELVQVAGLQGLDVRGLMTMAPLSDDPEASRPSFQRLSRLAEFLEGILPGRWGELSMGMTDDFEVAIEEGATCVRIGRAIFGEAS